MPQPPVQIFVSRHGARLDAADSNWQFTTATAYDTPLTLGGFGQARTLGNRIASLIVERYQKLHDPEFITPVESPQIPLWTPKSPSLQANEQLYTNSKASPYAKKPLSPTVASKIAAARIVIHTSPFLRCLQTSIAVSAGISQHLFETTSAEIRSKHPAPRPLLRLDAWLGEWLCEDYFSDITPPPSSAVMIASAKADLMRPSSAGALNLEPSVGYVPPNLNYSIRRGDPIPLGHVSHAKEYLDIDYGWDSLRFGDGGEYGEEWGSMHKRVKKGFRDVIDEYAKTGAPATAVVRARSASLTKKTVEIPKEPDTILIFVSHGAGCNALIGAMTNQPVLMDIGLTSLSMGIRKGPSEDPLSQVQTTTFSYPTDVLSTNRSDTISKVSASYDVLITASTSHLRRKTQSNSASPALNASPAARRQIMNLSMTLPEPALSGTISAAPIDSSTASNRRATVSSGGSNYGLWSRPTFPRFINDSAISSEDEPIEEKLSNFNIGIAQSTDAQTPSSILADAKTPSSILAGDTEFIKSPVSEASEPKSALWENRIEHTEGLWTGAHATDNVEHTTGGLWNSPGERKRRWTLNVEKRT